MLSVTFIRVADFSRNFIPFLTFVFFFFWIPSRTKIVYNISSSQY
jgi:hypothetical protein